MYKNKTLPCPDCKKPAWEGLHIPPFLWDCWFEWGMRIRDNVVYKICCETDGCQYTGWACAKVDYDSIFRGYLSWSSFGRDVHIRAILKYYTTLESHKKYIDYEDLVRCWNELREVYLHKAKARFDEQHEFT